MNTGKFNLQAGEKAMDSPSVAEKIFRVSLYKALRSRFEEHPLPEDKTFFFKSKEYFGLTQECLFFFYFLGY